MTMIIKVEILHLIMEHRSIEKATFPFFRNLVYSKFSTQDSLLIITWLGTLHSPTFWGMFPHTFLIFHTIYSWYKKKHKRLIINAYYFLVSFWHTDCDYE